MSQGCAWPYARYCVWCKGVVNCVAWAWLRSRVTTTFLGKPQTRNILDFFCYFTHPFTNLKRFTPFEDNEGEL